MKKEVQEAVIRLLEAVQEKFEIEENAAKQKEEEPEYVIKPSEFRDMCEAAGLDAETRHLVGVFALAFANGIVKKPDFIKFTWDDHNSDEAK